MQYLTTIRADSAVLSESATHSASESASATCARCVTLNRAIVSAEEEEEEEDAVAAAAAAALATGGSQEERTKERKGERVGNCFFVCSSTALFFNIRTVEMQRSGNSKRGRRTCCSS